jgi:hypothetical protein
VPLPKAQGGDEAKKRFNAIAQPVDGSVHLGLHTSGFRPENNWNAAALFHHHRDVIGVVAATFYRILRSCRPRTPE